MRRGLSLKPVYRAHGRFKDTKQVGVQRAPNGERKHIGTYDEAALCRLLLEVTARFGTAGMTWPPALCPVGTKRVSMFWQRAMSVRQRLLGFPIATRTGTNSQRLEPGRY